MSDSEDNLLNGIGVNAFRTLMRKQASTVAVITAGDKRRQGGLTATAVMSLTDDPASVAICVNQSASAHDLILCNGAFGVNFLGDGQDEISGVFSDNSVKDRRFEMVDWFPSDNGVPLLRGTAASAACSVQHVVPVFSHTLMLGVVHEIHTSDSTPLLYGDGAYGRFVSIQS